MNYVGVTGASAHGDLLRRGDRHALVNSYRTTVLEREGGHLLALDGLLLLGFKLPRIDEVLENVTELI